MARPRNPDDEEDDQLPQEGEDAGLDDDESRDEAEAGQESEDAEAEEGLEAEPQPSRATKRVQASREAAREAQERAARLERELQELRSQRVQPQQPQEESDEAFNARIALMTTEERLEAKLDRSERRNQRQIAYSSFVNADRADKAAFDARAAYDQRFKRYADKVEQVLQQARSGGNYTLDRVTALKYVIGDTIMANEGKVSQARQQGQQRIAKQQARTSGGRGDQEPQRRTRLGQGNTLADLEARLDGVII